VVEPAPDRMTYEEYLAAEAVSDTKHEYLRGEIFAMAGGTPTHARLAMAVGTALSNALSTRPCVVYSSDLRVRIEGTDLSTYPDITVICGSFEHSKIDANATTNPVLIVEILSDSTEAYDRGEKFAHYRRLPSLREYVLVSQREPRIESYCRNEAGEWVLTEARTGETLALRSLEGVRLETDAIYRDRLAEG
jgi:Uma2 family endonuclease